MITAAEENSRSKQVSILKGLEDGSETKKKAGSESKHYCNLNIFGVERIRLKANRMFELA